MSNSFEKRDSGCHTPCEVHLVHPPFFLDPPANIFCAVSDSTADLEVDRAAPNAAPCFQSLGGNAGDAGDLPRGQVLRGQRQLAVAHSSRDLVDDSCGDDVGQYQQFIVGEASRGYRGRFLGQWAMVFGTKLGKAG